MATKRNTAVVIVAREVRQCAFKHPSMHRPHQAQREHRVGRVVLVAAQDLRGCSACFSIDRGALQQVGVER
jgi:hypothetical protein